MYNLVKEFSSAKVLGQNSIELGIKGTETSGKL